MYTHGPNKKNSGGIDGESLQADVMRFMAIIAFCLVAIMALVRDVEAPEIKPMVSPEVVRTVLPKPEIVEPEIVEVDSVKPEIIQPEIVEAEPRVVEPQVAETPTEPEADEGLSLRFASDKDFLRLIANGKVRVYLFNDNQALRLDSNYAFTPAPVPNEVYELLPETIPDAIHNSANRLNVTLTDYNWGILIPGRIASRIAELVAVKTSGQLVINQFGEVQHKLPWRPSNAGT